MRKFAVALALFCIPFAAIGQTAPEVEIMGLQAPLEGSAGRAINATVTVKNFGDTTVSGLGYDAVYGQYLPETSMLGYVVDIAKNEEVVDIAPGASIDLPVRITPRTALEGQEGIAVRLYDANGGVLVTRSAPVRIDGEEKKVLKVSETDSGFVIPVNLDQEGDIVLQPLAETPVTNRYAIQLPDGTAGQPTLTGIFYSSTDYSDQIYKGELAATLEDGVLTVDLPQVTGYSEYYGYVYVSEYMGMESNKIEVRYKGLKSGAEIIAVQKRSVETGSVVAVDIKYYGFNNYGLPPEKQIANATLRVELLDRKGNVVASADAPAETLKSYEIGSTEGLEDDVDFAKTLTGLLETSVNVPFDGDAGDVSVRVTMYGADMSNILDTFETDVATVYAGAGGERTMLMVSLAVALAALVLIGLLVAFKKKAKLVTVAFGGLLFFGLCASGVSAYVIYFERGTWGPFDTGYEPTITNITSSRTGSYASNVSSITYTVNHTQRFWANNGYHLLQTVYPESNQWQSFADTSSAVTHIRSAITSTSKKNVISPSGIVWKVGNVAANNDYKSAEKVALKYGDSTQTVNASLPRTGNLSAGMHYFPIATMFCTESHGCMGTHSVSVYQICVAGAGVCPGEVTVDMCANISGTQSTVPSGYVQDSNGNCSNSCYPSVTPSNYGQACGCNDAGTVQCDGSCMNGTSTVPNSCVSVLTCDFSPVSPATNQTVTFTADSDAASPEYRWSDDSTTWTDWSTLDSITKTYSSAGTYLKYLGVDANNNDVADETTTCQVTVGCPGNQPNSYCQGGKVHTYQCTGSGWTAYDTGSSCGGNTTTIDDFDLEPKIISSAGGACYVTASAEGVAWCNLYRNGVPIDTDMSTHINASSTLTVGVDDNISVGPGTYELRCGTVDDVNVVETYPTTRRCFKNPDIGEN